MITASVILGIFVFLTGLSIRSGLIMLSIVMREIAHEIHIHAEVLTEIKYEGIGIDKKKNKFV